MVKTYQHHKPSPEGIDKIAKLRRLYSDLDNAVKQLAPDTRERSIELTNLEQSAMWAIKSVVIHDPLSEVEDTPPFMPNETR